MKSDLKSAGEKKKILISGAGVAGIICAVLLDKDQFDVELVEKAEKFRNIGFSITIWKSGFEIVLKLFHSNAKSLIPEKDYYKVTGFNLFGGGKLSLLNTLDANNYAYVFDRSHLMEMLEQVLKKNLNQTNLYFNKTIQEIKSFHPKVHILFSDRTIKYYDVVIISEGINSTTRKLLPIRQKVITIPMYLKYAWIENQTMLLKKGALFFAKNHLGVIHPPSFKNLFGFYYKKGLSRKDQKDFTRKALNRIEAVDGNNVDLAVETSNIFNLEEVYIKPYFFENVVLVGDAAHGRPPTLGFGTTLAIEDAQVLCNKINSSFNHGKQKTRQIFNEYYAQRISRVRKVYRLQSFVHMLVTTNKFKHMLLSFAIKIFIGKRIEKMVKKLASYKI